MHRKNTPFSVILFDIDHFKKINDTYGHQAGDFVLTELAATVKDMIRQADIFGRYGGEEFLVCLPETKVEKALYSAERLRKAVEEKEFIYDGKRIPVTISIGVASFRQTPEDKVSRFIKDADEALYFSKEHGRNCVTLHGQEKKFKQAA